MLSRLARFFSGFGRKASAVAPIIYAGYAGNEQRGIFPRRNLLQFAENAYRRNAVAFQCILAIAEGASYVPLKVMIGKKEAPETHPLVKLLCQRANTGESSRDFIRRAVAFGTLYGNQYVEMNCVDDIPQELYALRSERMRVTAGKLGVNGYVYDANGQIKKWERDVVTGKSDILHVKTFNPVDDWYGLSPVEPSMNDIDSHNLAGEWNQALTQNNARPACVLEYTPGDTFPAKLMQDQRDVIAEELNAAMSGPRNAGRIPILDAGLKLNVTGLSPAEMEYLEGRRETARAICGVFRTPPMILGIPGDNTYSNQKDARQSFTEETVLPTLDCLLEAFNHGLCPRFGEGITVVPDTKDLPAFAPKREARWNAVATSTWLTIDEKREATGYEPLNTPESQEVYIPSTLVPLSGMLTPPDGDETLDANGDPIPEVEDPADAAGDPAPPKPGKPPLKLPKPAKQPAKGRLDALLERMT